MGGTKKLHTKHTSSSFLCNRVKSLTALLCISIITTCGAAFVGSNTGAITSWRASGGVFQGATGGRSLGQTQSRFLGSRFVSVNRRPRSPRAGRGGSKSELGMFLGNDGGILGVGAPEIATILLVGYFILGPSELYKITKEIGKFIQNFRTLGAEASKSFEDSMENQLELQELRKAQTELSDAFNFRRSINTEPDADPFSETPPMAEAASGGAAASTVTEGVSGKKKRKRRRVKKKKPVELPNDDFEVPKYDIPDLDMSDAFDDSNGVTSPPPSPPPVVEESEEELAARIRAERMERLQNGAPTTPTPSEPDLDLTPDPAQSAAEQTRFASQLSDDWNAGIMANEDKLSPLAKVMDRLAILEKEREAANARLDEEFRLRTELEEKFYREKRAVLEEAAADISAKVYGDVGGGDGGQEVDMR